MAQYFFQVTDKYGLNKEVNPSDVMDTYIRQMGHPLVAITTEVGSKHVDATQELFLEGTENGVIDVDSPSPFG